ncbi:phosphoenolpyruvate--protein phosphotransferase [Desulforamulus hydrothermalis]|uniref:Phosphoenolpyruvate-protein phosphotransferase n=1 Tax=Desulforamulus hydrothermalis Lam5 = DSM 18033 TaxID=1121428 RepID=K8EFN7_9FIRM|nr:phosphoenolpyruvate--protein phosphotransferase [Desulforamulus hydrothermalis]CCO07506.1 Phosphoenolpyruvate-protein phosphotransferase [Desulforamulus hydrothermalis Lam5 = DSM 18033]SHH16965.1 phosphotransferase system, enzyme I, PtsI [Desulforamulus hydrothermalis Lam5 = DSM 18033]
MTGITIRGTGVSEGIRLGRVLLYKSQNYQDIPSRTNISADEVEHEIERLKAAREKAYQELQELIERARNELGKDKAAILMAQQAFLNDPAFCPAMEKVVREQNFSAEKGVTEIVERYAKLFEGMNDQYLRERAADVRDLGKRLIFCLQGKRGVQLAEIKEEVILVADDLAPSDTVQLNKKYILGFVTRVGGKTSHTAILARSLGIPAIVGLGEAIEQIHHNDFLVIDGGTGECIINPDSSLVKQYQEKKEKEEQALRQLAAFAFQPAVTMDGFQVEIAANIGTPTEAKLALEQGAEGIGLYRTEFLFMNETQMPSEEKQFAAYKQVVAVMGKRPVIIRTLDIGGDKELPYLSLPKEMNPFLGYRAIRLCLDQRELMVTQLRAILRASAFGQVKIMFPMIASLEEWRQAKLILEEVKISLTKEGVDFDPSIEVGIMVEVPSTAILAAQFAKEVDFFSIGTNDLVQYTLAVDRMNEKVSYLYDHLHPAVISLVKNVIDASHRAGKWTGMCGGMAGDPLAAPLLIGLGLDEWSMVAGSIKKVKQVISRVTRQECQELLHDVMQLATTDEVRKKLEQFHKIKNLL